jgi:glyoxylase-like metal-dependent hydrolase (beta-lactamase superfamily II)
LQPEPNYNPASANLPGQHLGLEKTMQKKLLKTLSASGVLALLTVVAPLAFGAAAEPPPVAASVITGGLYLVTGGGGANSSALIGDDGVLVVDAKLNVESADAELAVLKGLSPEPVRFLINTHVHPDHTGGNLSYANQGATIIAHEDVRTILSAGQRGGPPEPEATWPVITFGNGGGMTLHFDGETIHIVHMPPAHTADNSIVYFVNANVYHLGDIYSASRYPVIAGGTLQGFIDGIDLVLAEANASAKFIPGNGPVANRADVEAYKKMLVTVYDNISKLVADGKTLEEVVAAKPTAAFDATWGSPDRFLPGVYAQLKGQ